MKVGDLCSVAGGGFVLNHRDDDIYRAAAVNGIAVYLGEDQDPPYPEHTGRYYVFYEFHTGNRRKPFIWYWFNGTNRDSDSAYDDALDRLRQFKENEE
jgi:hypothetical protein